MKLVPRSSMFTSRQQWSKTKNTKNMKASSKSIFIINLRVKEKNMFANGRQYAEADIYAVFAKLMETGHKDMFRLES